VISTSANVSGEPSPKTFADIPEEIKAAVDYIVEPSLEKGSTGKASQIIKVGLDGQIKIIRG
jgi:L-threonylcarbamoyladenylate synthase